MNTVCMRDYAGICKKSCLLRLVEWKRQVGKVNKANNQKKKKTLKDKAGRLATVSPYTERNCGCNKHKPKQRQSKQNTCKFLL